MRILSAAVKIVLEPCVDNTFTSSSELKAVDPFTVLEDSKIAHLIHSVSLTTGSPTMATQSRVPVTVDNLSIRSLRNMRSEGCLRGQPERKVRHIRSIE